MTSSRRNLPAGAAAILLCVFLFANTAGSQAQEAEGNYGIGTPAVFLPKYLTYRTQQLNSGTPDVMRIRLGHVKGLSTSFTAMVGEMAVNLKSGAFDVTLKGLTPLQTYTVGLVDRTESDRIAPEPDTVFGLLTFAALKSSTLLTGVLPLNLPLDFTIDRVVVAPGLALGNAKLGAGTVNVFQKIFFRRLTLVNESTGAVLFKETTPAPRLFGVVPDLAAETDALLPLISPIPNPLFASSSSLESTSSEESSDGSVPLDQLISQGAQLFLEQTFAGNGRTCGTCHPVSNNFTIDPDFIATLPANDPLFVAEFNPALAQLERPLLMRSFGLILENLDGLEDPTNKFVMRGVPHTLGLQVSLEPDTSQVPTPAEMTGWSGDGSPGTGSLREFAIGAVTQHFTKDLARVEGRDFNLPSEHQLDAMEAFQLSLGRSADFNLANITFTDSNVDNGRSLFINGTGGGRCVTCHSNAGALATNLRNRNFNTNVEDVLHTAPRDLDFPHDGGFGRTPNPDGTFGNRAFNTASVVEAADTAPFFHNNVVSTLEDVVRFYGGPEFNNTRPLTGFSFTPTQVDQIADFMRGVNTLQNIDVAQRELEEILALTGNPQKEVQTRLQTALDETQDAIDVLNEGVIFPAAVTDLTAAQNLIVQAQNTGNPSQRQALIQQAITELNTARNTVATIAP